MKNFGGQTEILVFINMKKKKKEFPGGHIENMLFLEMEKLELIGGHIEIMSL